MRSRNKVMRGFVSTVVYEIGLDTRALSVQIADWLPECKTHYDHHDGIAQN